MARATVQVCSQCAFSSAQWHGQCPGCGAWNTLVEERARPARKDARGARAARRPASGARDEGARVVPLPLRDVGAVAVQRHSTGIGELDRVLGGGLVPGSSRVFAEMKLPEGVTSVAGSDRGLLVGTRFLGVLRELESDIVVLEGRCSERAGQACA